MLNSSKWNKIFIGTFYFIVLFIFFSFSSFLMFWLFIEINLIGYLLLVHSSLARYSFNYQTLYYFLIQSIASLMLIYSSFSHFFRLEGSLNFVGILCLILKIGIFPFHGWVVNISYWLTPFIMVLLLTMQKVPLFIIIFFCNQEEMLIVLFLRLAFGSITIYKCENYLDLLIFSSLYSTLWFFLISCQDYKAFFIFLIQYIYIGYWVLKKRSMSPESGTNLLFVGMFLIGVPPLSFFFFKYQAISSALERIRVGFFLLLWIFIFTSFLGYLKFFLNSFLLKMEVYKYSNGWFTRFFWFGFLYRLFFF